MRKLCLTLIALLLSGEAISEPANPVVTSSYSFSSGHQQVDLLELYTSEGCSSCPPAEAWFSQLLEHPKLFQRIVPVVFHVDYWNYLGWNDQFSKPAGSERQRNYRAEGGVKSVYTPGFVLNGREWRGWFSGQSLPANEIRSGVLHAQVSNGEIQAVFDNEATTGEPLELQVALLGFDLTTKVPAGENRGETLTHQFVVLQHTSTLSNDNTWSVKVPRSDVGDGKFALALWVTRPDTQTPLQATGGWLR